MLLILPAQRHVLISISLLRRKGKLQGRLNSAALCNKILLSMPQVGICPTPGNCMVAGATPAWVHHCSLGPKEALGSYYRSQQGRCAEVAGTSCTSRPGLP